MAKGTEKDETTIKDQAQREDPFAQAYRAYNEKLQEIANALQKSSYQASERLRQEIGGSHGFPNPNARFLEVQNDHGREMKSLHAGAAAQCESAFHDYARVLQSAWASLDAGSLNPNRLQEIHAYQEAALCNLWQLASMIPPQQA